MKHDSRFLGLCLPCCFCERIPIVQTLVNAAIYAFNITDKTWKIHDTTQESSFRGPYLPSFGCLLRRSIGPRIGPLIGCLIGCLIGRLIGCLFGRLMSCSLLGFSCLSCMSRSVVCSCSDHVHVKCHAHGHDTMIMIMLISIPS